MLISARIFLEAIVADAPPPPSAPPPLRVGPRSPDLHLVTTQQPRLNSSTPTEALIFDEMETPIFGHGVPAQV